MKTLFSLFFGIFLSLSSMIAQNESLSYTEEEVTFKVGDITLAGTLTLPLGDGPFPSTILISGSNADNRDAEASGFKPFKLIADHLGRKGIATLRYDDRGIGKSIGEHTYQYTIDELSDDVFKAINLLKTRNKIHPERIGLLGHSLGGIIAPLVASKSEDVAFIISMAGPVSKIDEMNLKYRKAILKEQGKTEQEIEQAVEIERRLVQVTRTGKGYEELIIDMKAIAQSDYEKLNENQKEKYENFEEYFQSSWYGVMLPYINTPLLKSLYDYDLITPLKNVSCPALFLFGEWDGQVKIQDSGEIIINALIKAENYNFTIRSFPKAGHYFVRDWSKKEKEFVLGFLLALSNWIMEQVGD